MSNPKISIVIPAYNEAESIGDVVGKIRSLHPDAEVIVIDDGSQDKTAERATQAGAVVYCHPYNIGNGAAIKSGIRVAGGDILVFMDADGQHDPAEIQTIAGFPDYDMVVGARSKGGQASLGRALGNKIYNAFASYVAKFPIKDLDFRLQGRKGRNRERISISASQHVFLPYHHDPGSASNRPFVVLCSHQRPQAAKR